VLKIYVGNLSFETTEDQLRELFAQYGSVDRAYIITDRSTGRSRGFGFIEMQDDEAAEAAISALNGSEFNGRKLAVDHARPAGGGSGRGESRGRGLRR